ncbi:D-amino acid dehydrogenase small subunit [Ameyamaea chiangmaiensis NBRC 103196]|uniref:FAD-binding oxidoreductase n=1 Tax=Ameyamaea chiangmaiensis TaxID=442969 RepID=A0A850PES5_9PROT|nr:FAD-binding oxidoreductase [Ameyamaea chiangmaiensis]MBS4074309.1 FAD-binding oxidoreductase [Ameyamaea chiangmaiensis]NVN41179.1 FAD-binding oxidoreductase [Ameyamaea chiangmaiensis]GBQ71597.1 D-amino acid dehydrogenase small subunit [Ameyamaea chiangmaiensis NBRC 103196]
MVKSVLVLGAGMIGVSTAIHLRERGLDVVLVDRKAAGQETSYGNAGLIQREATRPYAFPMNARDLVDVALARNNDVHYSIGALPALAGRLSAYARNSLPGPYGRIVPPWRALIETCLTEHTRFIDATNSWDLVTQGGWRSGFRSEGRDFDAAREDAITRVREDGLSVDIEDSRTLASREPALIRAMAGSIWWKDAWAVSNPGELVARYARHFTAIGGAIAFGDAATLDRTASGWSVRTPDGVLNAEATVVALGPWSDDLAKRLGYSFPLFVKRGYHRHYTCTAMPAIPMLDVEHGVMIAPMQAGLRLTTGAEFLPRDDAPSPVQLDVAERGVREIFALGAGVEATPWLGSRPVMPDMLPNIGAAPRDPSLWFHFGHAHQGFTLGPSSGRLLAELMTGETPFVDPTPYAPARWLD